MKINKVLNAAIGGVLLLVAGCLDFETSSMDLDHHDGAEDNDAR